MKHKVKPLLFRNLKLKQVIEGLLALLIIMTLILSLEIINISNKDINNKKVSIKEITLEEKAKKSFEEGFKEYQAGIDAQNEMIAKAMADNGQAPVTIEEAEERTTPVDIVIDDGAGARVETLYDPYEDDRKMKAWIFQHLAEVKAQEEREAAEKKAQEEREAKLEVRAAQINTYLAQNKPSSPMCNYGRYFAEQEERTGVSASLLVGLTYRETSLGTNGYTCQVYNYWCMKSNSWTRSVGISSYGEWCAWPSVAMAIQQSADFVLHFWGPAQTAHDCRGYCEGHPAEWVRAVEGCRMSIENIVIN